MKTMPPWLALTMCVLAPPLFLASNATTAEARKPPADAPRPVRVTNLMSTLLQTAAIVEGEVKKLESDYHPVYGPWTQITLGELTLHQGTIQAGQPEPNEIVIRQRGGEMPGGRIGIVPTNAQFTVGERYLVFLRNTSWVISPYIGWPLRLVNENGRTFLVDPRQRALQAVTTRGFSFSEDSLFADRDRFSLPTQRTRGYSRNANSIPSRVLSVSELLSRIDAEANVRRIQISGEFYDEPKSMRVPGRPHDGRPLPTEEEQRKAARTPAEVEPNTEPELGEEVD